MIKNCPSNAGDIRDVSSNPGSGRPLEKGMVSPLQYSCLENSMDRGAWWTTVHGVTKSWTQPKYLRAHIRIYILSQVLLCYRLLQNIECYILLLVTHMCPTLCDPVDYSPPGSSIHGVFQVRILEWVSISGPCFLCIIFYM